ncbi:hypothetical protein STEG23_010246, partial [Scotinomys teguina]
MAAAGGMPPIFSLLGTVAKFFKLMTGAFFWHGKGHQQHPVWLRQHPGGFCDGKSPLSTRLDLESPKIYTMGILVRFAIGLMSPTLENQETEHPSECYQQHGNKHIKFEEAHGIHMRFIFTVPTQSVDPETAQ